LLGQGRKILSELLKKSGLGVIYNTIKFQSEGNKKDGNIINTCGRHIILRLITMLGNNYNLDKYIKFMDKLKKDSGNTYDEIVSHLIQDVIRI